MIVDAFRVIGLGSRVQMFGFRVLVGLRVLGLGRVQGVGFGYWCGLEV